MTGHRLPQRLQRPTVREALVELRFKPKDESFVAILPGLLYSKVGADYGRHLTLPAASIPPQIRASNPDLQYAAQLRFLGGGGFSLYLGDQVAGASVAGFYPGWGELRPRVLQLLSVIRDSNLVEHLERISFKYINVIDRPVNDQLAALNLSVVLAGQPAPETGFSLRTEYRDDRHIRIVEVVTNTSVKTMSGESMDGLLLGIDAIRMMPDQASMESATEEVVEGVHQAAKSQFFQLLTEPTLQSLGPVYTE